MANKKRAGIIAAVVGLVAGASVAAIALRDGSAPELVPGASTSVPDVSRALESASGGQACVVPSTPLPAGAPSVPVPTGIPPTALERRELVPGNGATVTPDATVTVDYVGVACSTGEIFDSSYARGEPSTFALADVIPGWRDGLTGTQVGSRVLLGVPPELAYGSSGLAPLIGPDETLWFVVDVRDVASP